MSLNYQEKEPNIYELDNGQTPSWGIKSSQIFGVNHEVEIPIEEGPKGGKDTTWGNETSRYNQDLLRD